MFRPNILLRATRNPSMPLRKNPTRSYATQPPPPFPPSSERIARFNRRLPKFLRKYTNALGNAPLTHITSFLILHEITAVVPLLGLAATFHYTHWLPGWFTEGKWVLQGVERFGKYFRKKGWIRSEDAVEAEREVEGLRLRDRAWGIGEGGTRLVVEFATAYAVTKMLLPLRIIASIWGTPWFAKAAVVPALGAAKKWFGWARAAKPGASGQGAMGTGASLKPGMKKDNSS